MNSVNKSMSLNKLAKIKGAFNRGVSYECVKTCEDSVVFKEGVTYTCNGEGIVDELGMGDRTSICSSGDRGSLFKLIDTSTEGVVSRTTDDNNIFLLELATLLENHNMYLASPVFDKEKNFAKVAFQTAVNLDVFPKLKRSHVSAHDLRCESGMTSREANDAYSQFKLAKSSIDEHKPTIAYTKEMYDSGKEVEVGMAFQDSAGVVSELLLPIDKDGYGVAIFDGEYCVMCKSGMIPVDQRTDEDKAMEDIMDILNCDKFMASTLFHSLSSIHGVTWNKVEGKTDEQ